MGLIPISPQHAIFGCGREGDYWPFWAYQSVYLRGPEGRMSALGL